METTLTVEIGDASIAKLADAIAASQQTTLSVETTLPVNVTSISDPGYLVALTVLLVLAGAAIVLALRFKR